MIGSFLKKNFKKLVSCMVLGTIGMSIFPVESVQALTRDSEKEKIINQYIKGVKMLPEQVEARKEKAKELGLEEYVDDNYFLTDKWYEGRSEADINRIGANILVDTVTNEELDAWSSNLMQGIATNKVTKYEMVSAGGSTVGKYEVDGKMAFCAQHSATSPAKGAPTSNARLVTKDSVRKVLYYGYGGPKKLSDINGNAGWVTTTLGLSYAYTGSGGPKAKAFVDRVSKMATPPSGFKVYVVDTNGGRTQDLMYWNYSPKGTLQIEKSSAVPSMTVGNNCYSLEGAIYGVYKNSNATNKVGELKTNASGKSNILTLDAGVYYIKEITPPKGFALDKKIYSIKVNADKLSVGKYKDRPQADPVSILLRKVDAETGESKPIGGASLKDARFTLKWYAGEYKDGVDPASLGKKPNWTWVLKTDDRGFIHLRDDYKVSGPAFWYDSNKRPTLPLGTITIQETQAPNGYKINPEIFVRKITSNGTAENVNTYNAPIVKEEVIKGQVKLIKVDEETGAKLEGAKFEVKDKKTGKVLETLTTDKKGEAITKQYPFGTELVFREIKAPDKYVLNGKEYFATINDKQQTIEITVTNRIIKGSISIHKIDKDTKKGLEGVEFDVLDSNDKVVEHLVTDKNGNLKTKDLVIGVYKFVETKGLDGYLIDNTPIVVNITENKEYGFTVENEKLTGSMELLKVDNDTKEPMKDVEFKVVGLDSFDKNKEFTLKTNEEGKAVLNGLHKGKFRLTEVKTLDTRWICIKYRAYGL
ncbi:SpaA isopeptide-forming pilin-related protein (plasmid) [Clostridium baratii]